MVNESEPIRIVNIGRGRQLSTSRVRVQDLVPYFQEGCTYAEIRSWIPSLTDEEIAVVEKFYRENQAELDEEDAAIRVIEESRKNPEWVEDRLAAARIKRLTMMEEHRARRAAEVPS